MAEIDVVKKVTVKEDADRKSNTKQFLTFYVGNEVYGIEVRNVREVIEYENVYRIPVVPPYIMGVINLRGEVVPVIDMCYRFYKKRSELTKLACIVIVEIENDGDVILMGFVIDEINAVIAIADENIEPTPGFGAKIRTDFIGGVGKVDNEFIILLDAGKILDVEELSNFSQDIIA